MKSTAQPFRGCEAQPFQGKKKGADTGIDGVKFFRDLDRKEVRKIVVSVKGGGIKPDDVRALNHVREREKAEIALFISLDKPTSAMVKRCRVSRILRKPRRKEVRPRAVAHDRRAA
ncbi:MAG: restriction endonuclease [Chthoniobacterales bacterium]